MGGGRGKVAGRLRLSPIRAFIDDMTKVIFMTTVIWNGLE